MLRSLENLLGYEIAATDGAMGTVADFFFADDVWKVGYLVVSAGGWLNRKQVLLAASAVHEIVDLKREVRVQLTRELVYRSPDVDTHKPVTRQNEMLLAEHYDWKPYWTPDPFLGVDLPTERLEIDGEVDGSDPHLRSFREITTYEIEGDPPLSFVADMIVNDQGWRVNGLVTAKSRERDSDAWLVPAQDVSEIDWTRRRIRLAGSPDSAGLAAFDPAAPVNPRRVAQYFDYHGRLHHLTVLSEIKEGN